MDFKYNGYIEIRKDSTNRWGPFDFDMSDGLADSAIIHSATVNVFEGKIYANTYTGLETDISSLLVEAGSIDYPSSQTVRMYLQYPGDTYRNKILTMKINVYLNSVGGEFPQYPFYFPYIKII